MRGTEILDHCEEQEIEVTKLDGFDDAIIGLGTIAGADVLIYSEQKIVESLMKSMDIPRFDAIDYCYYNVIPTPDCVIMDEEYSDYAQD